MIKVIEIKPNIKEDEPMLCPVCNAKINRICNEEGTIHIACENDHVFEVTEVAET